jgi:selenoprotein W-related protein
VNELLQRFEPEIESVRLVPSDGGRFDVWVNAVAVYSKLETGRHAEPGEIIRLVQEFINRKK